MTYTGAMVLPKNAVVLPEQEMRYVEGGGTTSKWTTKAYLVKRRLESFMVCSSFAGALSSLSDILSGKLINIIISHFTVGAWTNSWYNCARKAYNAACVFNSRDKNTRVTLTITTGTLYKCTGMSVKKAR